MRATGLQRASDASGFRSDSLSHFAFSRPPTDKSLGQRIHLPEMTHNGEFSTSMYYVHDSNASLHVYFALLIVIICCVSFYVLMKWRLRRLVKTSPFGGPLYASKTPRGHANLYSPLPVSLAPVCRADRLSQPPLRLATRVSPPEVKITMNEKQCSTRYSDLALSKRRCFEASLNSSRADGKDWRLLAKELDFSEACIKSFASVGGSQGGPAHHLLQSWSQRERRRATVGLLVVALLRVGRLDAAGLLDPASIASSPAT